MHKLIPTIYFYTVSLIGLVLLIIGIFASIHFVVNITQFSNYPLGYNPIDRCQTPQPVPAKGTTEPVISTVSKEDCLKEVDQERQLLKTQDLEKAVSFTIIGSIVFSIHFYFARKQSKSTA